MAFDDSEHRVQRRRFYVMLGCTGALFAFAPTTATHEVVAPLAAPNPFVAHALPARARYWLQGEVAERLPAGAYVYLRVRESNGAEAWLVSLRATTPKQARVQALVLGQAVQFHSARLRRDFSPLFFAAVRGQPP